MDVRYMSHGKWAKWGLYIFIVIFFGTIGLIVLISLLSGGE
jgi:hypothetical protein